MDMATIVAAAPKIDLYDPLADLLGSADSGKLHYDFTDAVKLTGHACPTVASAFLLTLRALAHLYPDQLPRRGEILVRLRQGPADGTTGVIAQVVGQITGAAGEGGFAGLAGQYRRRNLLRFNQDIPHLLQFERLDTGAVVDVDLDLSQVPAAAEIGHLLPLILAGEAGKTQREVFQQLWRRRLFEILVTHVDNPLLVRLYPQVQDQPAIT